MTRRRIARTIGVLLSVVFVIGVQPIAHAAEGRGAQVTHHLPGCTFEPGDVPGVNVFFPADCLQIVTPSGRAVVVARGQLPPGFSLARTFQGTLPCSFLGQTVIGHIAATRSGTVHATCHFANV
jgi:hypothetical protein